MPSLKEVRSRIGSISSTMKVTSAMKMVASAKLKKAQNVILSFLPYQEQMEEILARVLSLGTEVDSPLIKKRPVEKIAIVPISSNSALCGSFNANVIKKTIEIAAGYHHLKEEDLYFFPMGKKISEALTKQGYQPDNSDVDATDKPDFDRMSLLSDQLSALYVQKRVDKVILIYNHFKNQAVQEVVVKEYLPFDFSTIPFETSQERLKHDYIFEPDHHSILTDLIPQVLHITLYTALLDAQAAEHAARANSMQIATENGDLLIKELTLQYNKARQSAITNEILEVTAGANAL